MSRTGWDNDWPPRSKPLRPANGIKAQSKRGAFASGWWAKRWIAGLEAFGLGSRLARGRSYARSGQVTDITLEQGGVRAYVQGSRAKPYAVTIRLRELTTIQWQSVGAAIGNDVRLCAALLAGEMPQDIESAFAAADLALFPASADEMKTACSCPDWSNPCKHVAAVFYLIGEEFDRDPFLLFVVRGLARDAVRDLFVAPPEPIEAAPPTAQRRARGARSTRVEPAAFWGDDVTPPRVSTPMSAVPTDDPAILKRAGKFPFWRGDVALADAVIPIYDNAARFALDWLADRTKSQS